MLHMCDWIIWLWLICFSYAISDRLMDLADRLAGTIDVLAPLPVHPRDAASEPAAAASVAPEELEPVGAFWLVCTTLC